METLQAQLEQAELDIAKANNQGNYGEIPALEQKRDLLKVQIADEAAKTEQEAAQQVRIETETQEITSFLDSLIVEGLTMRDLAAGENEYQMLRIAVETKLIEQSVKSASEVKLNNLQHQEELRAGADRELQLKRQNDELQAAWETLRKANAQLAEQISQAVIEKEDAYSKIEAAVAKADGLELLVSEKQAQIDILRTENAIGAVGATQVIDQSAQLKEFADKIKASRTYVYDVTPDNEYAPKNFSAKRADTGETVTYNWTQARNYIELKDEAEVNRFRQQHAEQNAVPDPALDTPIDVPTIPAVAEVTAPEVQFQGEVSTLPTAMESGNANQGREDAETVSRTEFEALKADVEVLKRRQGMVA